MEWEKSLQHGPLSSIFRRASTPPDYVIVTGHSVEQCRLKLTGREKTGWFGNEFVRTLQLRGRVFHDHLTLRLPSHSITGSLESCDVGTRLSLHVSDSRGDANPVFDLTLLALVVAIPIVVYGWWQNQSLPGFLIVPATFLGYSWFKELRIRWPDYPRTPDDAARMLAGLVDGSIESGKQR